jgi:tripartite-type tricarboxylate transporter receptor subunit TctC
MPAEAMQKISASIAHALGDEAFRASLTKAGFSPLKARDEADIKAFMDADKARWLDVVKKLNFSLD